MRIRANVAAVIQKAEIPTRRSWELINLIVALQYPNISKRVIRMNISIMEIQQPNLAPPNQENTLPISIVQFEREIELSR
jgi:hypothetical protein